MDPSPLVELIFPTVCVCCRRGEPDPVHGFCGECACELRPVISPWCRSCGGTADGALDVCSECLTTPRKWHAGVAALNFSGPARQLLHRFKYNGDVTLAPFFGHLLAESWRARAADWQVDCLVPVPLHWYRRWRRGYNQSELVAKALSRETGIPVEPILARTKHVRPQASLTLAQRKRNLAGAFVATPAAARRTIALLDDVFTTGSTLDACTRALLRAGADRVIVVTVARG